MKACRLLLVGVLLVCALSADEAYACTTFVLGDKNRQVFGRNYDWDVEDALVIINKRGMSKSGYPNPAEKGTPASWVSKYGSVTFNQYGRELPTGGMNEAGLIVETMALSEARYPRPDKRPYLGSAFKILDAVSARRTVWRIVYDNVNMKIFFRTRANPIMRIIDVTRLDFACQTPVQIIDLNTQLSGEITDRFEDYTRQKNRTLIENSFRKTSFLRNYSDAALNRLSDFPDSMTCNP